MQETNKINGRLNDLSKDVMRELFERKYASVYLQHLVGRVNKYAEVTINSTTFRALLVDDSRDPSAGGDEELHEQNPRITTDLRLSILEQRRKDAKIGQGRAWRTLECLTHTLALGIWLFHNLFSLGLD